MNSLGRKQLGGGIERVSNFKDLLKPYKLAYFGKKKIAMDPRMKLLMKDPLVFFLVWLQRFASVMRAAADVGRLVFK